MKKLKNFAKTLWKDESGQGMAEYVLLMVIVVGLIMVFRKDIESAVKGKIGEVSGSIENFKVQ